MILMQTLLPVREHECRFYPTNHRSDKTARRFVVRNLRVVIWTDLELGTDCTCNFRCFATLLRGVLLGSQRWMSTLTECHVENHDTCAPRFLGRQQRTHR